MITMTLEAYTCLVVLIVFLTTCLFFTALAAATWRSQLIDTQASLENWRHQAQRAQHS